MDCPVCGSTDTRSMLRRPGIPIPGNTLWKTREEALRVPRASLDLRYCRRCSHLFNASFDGSLLSYTEDYENSLFFSPLFKAYAEAEADALIGRYGLAGKHVVEIGCGKGEFLAMLCARGGCRGTGFDRSYSGGFEDRTDLAFFRGYYPDSGGNVTADLLLCRQVLEHIEAPSDFLASTARILGNGSGGAAVFEVPNGLYMAEDNRFWDLTWEHCGYYTPYSLAALFERCGFTVDEIRETFGRQYLVIHARHGGPIRKASPVATGPDGIEPTVRAFARELERSVENWKGFVFGAPPGTRIAVWGAGTRAIGFLNLVGLDAETVPAAVDLNPRKQGLFLTGTGQAIIAPEELRVYRPDIVLLMNPIYEQEVRDRLRSLSVECTVIPV